MADLKSYFEELKNVRVEELKEHQKKENSSKKELETEKEKAKN